MDIVVERRREPRAGSGVGEMKLELTPGRTRHVMQRSARQCRKMGVPWLATGCLVKKA
ncbi:hypothetical protein CMEL01_05796 [Colletotrichum melonis]|nr:uncharacterized protein CCOS01_01116 [Colletotrichum costaricense]KAI3550799.1 hypothetical protein CSPX01_01294 [Colletotrichum filicis]KAK1454137.1 hypothetical protein CMEL01_05796 [Colletotrichum melonis]KAK1464643.1 hypothetical protein CCUS01_07890 [Colletotrichum cuscutae]KAK1539802.1 hypothetical protein CCOS01_01116 [Colletotrichum costaricense]